MTSRESREHQQQRAGLVAETARAARDMWRRVTLEDIRRSWATQVRRLLVVVFAAQIAAAQQAEHWISRTRGTGDPVGQIVPENFAGTASDGRDMDGLLMYPALVTINEVRQGVSPERALARGATWLDFLTRTQIADTGRAADSVAMAVRLDIIGYERVVHLPACSRCIVLAGRLYQYNQGFQRHPACDCTMEPVTREQRRNARPENTPRALFTAMSAREQDKAFTIAGAKAIRDGADISRVVNARRGMTTATYYGRTIKVTRERARRGARSPRLMPEEIYRRAKDREHALNLLRKHGYIL